MSGVLRIAMRLVGTTKSIADNNTSYLGHMCHWRNGFNHVTRNSITSAPKKSVGYWKTMSAVTKKILLYSTIPLTALGAYCIYKTQTDPEFWKDIDIITAVNNEALKYSIIPSKIITSSVLFDDSEIKIKSQKDNLTLINDNTRNLILSEELNANIQEPFPKGEPIPIKIGKFNGLLDNGKLTLTTEDGDTTFTIHNTLSLEVEKTSTTLQNKIAAKKKEHTEIALKKLGKFNVIIPGSEFTLKTPESEKKWTAIIAHDSPGPDDGFGSNLPAYNDLFPIVDSFSVSCNDTVKIQADESDEVYHFQQTVNIECDKKVDGDSKNKIAAEKKLSKDDIVTEKSAMIDILIRDVKICDVMIDSGTVVFKRPDGHKVVVRYKLYLEVLQDGKKTYLYWRPDITVFPLKPLFTFF